LPPIHSTGDIFDELCEGGRHFDAPFEVAMSFLVNLEHSLSGSSYQLACCPLVHCLMGCTNEFEKQPHVD
jgi:hypothetical protein